MRLSKAGYYADFIAYPIIIIALTTRALRPPESLALGHLRGGSLASHIMSDVEGKRAAHESAFKKRSTSSIAHRHD